MSRRSVPEPVVQALIEAGVLTADRLGRAAQLRTCPRCHRAVLVGLDADRAALRVTCDPAALEYPVGEAVALLSGRSTYELYDRELKKRSQFSIKAGNPRPIVASHECGRFIAPSPEIVALFMPPRESEIENDPPF